MPHLLAYRTFNYFQMKMGDFVTIGQNCIIEAVSIGNGSEIEDDCIIVRLWSKCSHSSGRVGFPAHSDVLDCVSDLTGRIRHHQRFRDHRTRHSLVPEYRLPELDPLGGKSWSVTSSCYSALLPPRMEQQSYTDADADI